MTAEIDPLGNITTHAFDDRDFMISTTDPLGNVTRFEYDAFGNVTKTTDPRGNITRNVYDNFGQLLQSIDATGAVTTYEYFPNLVNGVEFPGRGPLKQTTDPHGSITRYTYNPDGSMRMQQDALGRQTFYTYNANGNRLTEERTRTLPGGGTENIITRYEYDANGRQTTTTNPDESITRVEYNALGQEKARVDQLGRRTEFTYDYQGRLTTTTYAFGTSEAVTERTEYDAEGRRSASIDRAGRRTTFEYDALGRLVKTTFPGSPATFTRTEYDSAGRVFRSIDARGNATRFEYDSAGRRVRTIDALGHEMAFSYDSGGNQRAVTDALGRTTYFEYDSANRQVRQIFPDSTFTGTEYDSLGRRIASVDQAGVRTQFSYDALGRLTGVTDALSGVTQYEYDEVGNRVAQVDAENRTTRYEFDAMGRRTKRILPLGQSEALTYDAAGNLRTRRDFNGRTTTFDYDVFNRLAAKTPDPVFGAPAIEFTYTPTGQRATMDDAMGRTTYAYDDRNRLTDRATPFGTLTYAYDANGNLTHAHSNRANGYDMTYRHDELNRITEAEDARTGVTGYAFDAVGNLATVAHPNGATHTYTYNNLNRLTNLSVTRGGFELLRYGYTLGPTGNRTQISELNSSRIYTYDNLYRLTNEQLAFNSASTYNGVLHYTYDRAGNRLTRTNVGSNPSLPPTTAYSVDNNDRLNSDGYDAAGNTTTADDKTFSYDFENRIASMNGGAVALAYDGDGNLVSRTEGGVTRYYLVDLQNPTGFSQIVEELEGATPATAVLKNVNNLGLDLISRREVPTGTVLYFLTDGLGSVRGVIDQAGNVTTYDFDAFGTMIRTTGPAVDNPYLFTGERYDAALGLYHLRARYMEPGRGRFWNMDSFEGADAEPMSLHKYTYANGNPVNRIDPSGKFSINEVMAVAAIGAIIQVAQIRYLPLGLVGAASREKRILSAAIDHIATLAGRSEIENKTWAEQSSQLKYLLHNEQLRATKLGDNLYGQAGLTGPRDFPYVFAGQNEIVIRRDQLEPANHAGLPSLLIHELYHFNHHVTGVGFVDLLIYLFRPVEDEAYAVSRDEFGQAQVNGPAFHYTGP